MPFLPPNIPSFPLCRLSRAAPSTAAGIGSSPGSSCPAEVPAQHSPVFYLPKLDLTQEQRDNRRASRDLLGSSTGNKGKGESQKAPPQQHHHRGNHSKRLTGGFTRSTSAGHLIKTGRHRAHRGRGCAYTLLSCWQHGPPLQHTSTPATCSKGVLPN